jgi:hypothetical protein
MAVQNEYIEAFNTCIDRLHQGDELNTILDDYPDMAPQLRPMLEAGRAINRIAYAPADVQQAQQRVEPAVQNAITGGGSSGIWWIISVIALIGIGAGLQVAGVSLPGNQINAEATVTVSPAVMPAATVPIAPSATSETLMIFEGPVNSITSDYITVYDTEIAIPADDARFAALQPGDVIRLELDRTESRLEVVDFELRNANLISSDTGQVWRDDNCNNPPPAWASDRAAQWQQRCLPSDTHSRGRGGSAASES